MITPHQIPSDLKRWQQWICWRYVDRGAGKKPDKQPVNPKTLHNAGVHWPNTWTSFQKAYATYCRHHLAGIGFVLTPKDPYVGVDIDNCIGPDGITPAAHSMVEQLNSYTEVSPSGRGLRILLTCSPLPDNRRTRAVELYAHSRYLTITGHHVAPTPVTIAVCSLDRLATILPQTLEPHQSAKPSVLTKPEYPDIHDTELWERIFTHDKYGSQHRQRYHGDTALEGGDHSFTVIRLLNCLACWTNGNAAKMRRMILMAPLANEKWLSKRNTIDWLDYQIADAIAYVQGRKRS